MCKIVPVPVSVKMYYNLIHNFFLGFLDLYQGMSYVKSYTQRVLL